MARTWAASLVLVAAAGVSQPAAADRKPVPVTIQAPERVQVSPGASSEAAIRVTIAEGFHIQANPASDRFLVPAELTAVPAGGVKLAGVSYPEGKPYRLQGADSDLSVYGGTVKLGFVLEASGEAKAGDLDLEATLRYQACDSRRCLFPASLSVTIPVRVAGK